LKTEHRRRAPTSGASTRPARAVRFTAPATEWGAAHQPKRSRTRRNPMRWPLHLRRRRPRRRARRGGPGLRRKNVVEAVGGSEPAAEEPKPAEAAPAEPAVAPVEQEVVKCSMRGRRKPPQEKAGRRPQAKRMVNFGDHDAGKWVLTSTEYDGSYGIIGGTPVVQEKTGPIQEGLDLLKQEPHKYLSLWYQTDMMSWPTEQQQYSLCERRKQRIVVKETQGGPFTYVESKYHALPDCEVQPDQFTDSMAYAGAPCTQGKQPGRGQGCADVPGLSVIKDVDPNDVLQGSVGDCWLLSAMSALAEFSGAVKKVFNKTPGIESLPGQSKPNVRGNAV
ncbi:unnamed protein product, partial [Prorocentrum cordatum]